MAKRKGVSGKTHTKQQLNDYANQNKPNNKAYRARRTNEEKARKTRTCDAIDVKKVIKKKIKKLQKNT